MIQDQYKVLREKAGEYPVHEIWEHRSYTILGRSGVIFKTYSGDSTHQWRVKSMTMSLVEEAGCSVWFQIHLLHHGFNNMTRCGSRVVRLADFELSTSPSCHLMMRTYANEKSFSFLRYSFSSDILSLQIFFFFRYSFSSDILFLQIFVLFRYSFSSHEPLFLPRGVFVVASLREGETGPDFGISITYTITIEHQE